MAKAKAKEKLVERVVIGPKGIHAHDPKSGDRIFAKVGDTVFLPARSAKKFARYLEAPEVAKAKAAVAKAEAEAAVDPDVVAAKVGLSDAKADASAEESGDAKESSDKDAGGGSDES